jgi:hypothetical protein
MLIFHRENRRFDGLCCLATVLAAAGAAALYLAYGFRSGSWSWPGGSSPPGFLFGVLGGAIILFEMLLWPRKSLWRGRRLGRTKWWMTAHIWLGLLTVPLLLLHGDFHFNLATSTLAAVLVWLLVIVVASGVFGLVVQNTVPRMMLENVPAETIHSQIGHVLDQYRAEAERLVGATCGRSPRRGEGGGEDGDERADDAPPYMAVEAVRRAGRLTGKVVQVGIKARFVPESEPLLAFFQEEIEPYLRVKSASGLALASPKRAASMFEDLKVKLRREAHDVVDKLADLCDQRRQFELQSRLHGWLFVWLAVHVGLSVALVLLMFAHVVLSLKYV